MARQLRFDLGSHLFFGDNLTVLPEYVADESVDLIYLDPPFNSKRSYNRIFKHVDGTPVAAQIKAFDDTWHWSVTAEIAYKQVVEQGGLVSRAMRALRDILDTSDMFAYLTMMAPRLVELRRVLKPTGSIYLHCDPTASHYLKVLMDAVFGPQTFRNEVVWKRAQTVKGNTGQGAKAWDPNTDSILFYTRSSAYTFNPQFTPYSDEYLSTHFRFEDERGRYRLISMIGPGGAAKGNPRYEFMGVTRYWRYSKTKMQELVDEGMIVQTKPGTVPQRKLYLGSGVPVQSLWTDIGSLQASDAERLGYPTQKPMALLERIIAASSNPGDIVLDPFCGCGTAIDAAQKLGRRWVGIDITKVAIEVIQLRLKRDHPTLDYSIRGIPTTMEEVEFLAGRDKYAFQQWVCDRLGIDADIRKGADHGIDGEIVRYSTGSELWRAVVSVKGGGVNVDQVRVLRAVMDREKADAGIFVTYKRPTKPMRVEALLAGLTGDIPNIQILTAEDLINGKMPQMPLPTGVAPMIPVLEPEHREVVPTHPKLAAVATGA